MKTASSFERSERILGEVGLRSLREAYVMVIGLGGVGSSCVEALARGGIGNFAIIDADVVERSNINRQAIAFECTIGRPKVEVMKDMILQISPDAHVSCIQRFVLPEDVDELVDQHPLTYCVDAQDTVVTKIALAKACEKHGVPFISSMGAANVLDPTALEFADISKTHGCPLSKAVRKRGRKEGLEHMQVLYSPSGHVHVDTIEGAERSERTNLGTMSYMPPIMGQMLASKVIRDICKIE